MFDERKLYDAQDQKSQNSVNVLQDTINLLTIKCYGVSLDGIKFNSLQCNLPLLSVDTLLL